MSKVLFAEDEPALLEAFCELSRERGYEVFAANDGLEAIAMTREHLPDVVVTDYMMPGRNGLEVIAELKKDPDLRKIPVILVTAARPPEHDLVTAWRYLNKPVMFEQLDRVIQEALTAGALDEEKTSYTAGGTAKSTAQTLVREDMLNWVAHEIKTPLAAAGAALALVERGVKKPEPVDAIIKRLSVVSRQLRRMDELVNSVLDAAQLQDGRLTLRLQPCSFNDLVEEAVQYRRELNPEWDLSVVGEQGFSVNADRERLRQVIDNLLSNAVKYGRPGNAVRVEVCNAGANVQARVMDFGEGIAADALPGLFTRFHRVPGQGGRGHGLGLFIAASLVQLHGGALEVQSELGKGSTFIISLPRAVVKA